MAKPYWALVPKVDSLSNLHPHHAQTGLGKFLWAEHYMKA